MKTENKIRLFGLTLIVISSVYFALYVKANEFKNNVTPTQDYTIAKK